MAPFADFDLGRLRGKRVLITGATGFLGGAIAARLLADGISVVAQGRKESVLARLREKGAMPAAADLASAPDVARLFAEFGAITHVVHCAALSSPWGTYAEFYRANVTATELLADAALAAGVERFIHISTASIYSARMHRRAIREDAPLPPKKVSGYGETKWLSEVRLDERIGRGLWAIKLRPLNVMGAGDATVFPRLLRLAQKAFIPILPEGDAETDFTPVENVVDCVLAGLTTEANLAGRAYNISNGEPVTIPEALALFHHELGIPTREKKLRPGAAFLVARAVEWTHRKFLRGREPGITVQALCALFYSRSLDISAARKDLGFRPPGDTLTFVRERVREYRKSKDERAS